MKTEKPQKPKRRDPATIDAPRKHRRRVTRRRGYATFPNYRLNAILETGIDRCKSIEDIRSRMRRMVEDDTFWLRLAEIVDAQRHEDTAYTEAQKYMERTFGSRAK